MASGGIVESGSSQDRDREREQQRGGSSQVPRARLVQKLMAAGNDLPAFITELIQTQAIMVAGTEAAAFLIEHAPDGKSANLRLIKHVRPDDSPDEVKQKAIEAFAEIVKPCIEKQHDGVVEIGAQSNDTIDPQFCLVTLLRAEEQVVAVSAVIARAPNAQRAQQRLSSMQMVAGYFEIFTLRRSIDQSKVLAQTNQNVLQLATSVATAEGFDSASMALCNELAARTGATRVAIGWIVGDKIKLKAMSHTEQFDKKQELAVMIIAAMEECWDNQEIVQFEPNGTSSENVTRASAELSRTQGGVSVLSLPLRRIGEMVGVITLEFNAQKKLPPNAGTSLSIAVELLAPQLYDRYQNDRYLITKAGLSTVWLGEQIFRSPKHMLAKVITLAVVLGLLFITFYKPMYHVVSPFTFAAIERNIISSPMDGFIGATVNVKPGDVVKKGDVLLEMKTDELRLKKSQSDAQARSKELEAQRLGADERKTAERLQALEESKSARAEADLYAKQIDDAMIKAPMDGVILSGDWIDKKHSPVRKGDELFKIAKKGDLRIEMNVSERDIQWLHDTDPAHPQEGDLATTSLPTERKRFYVERIIPLPVSEQGANTFKVYGIPKEFNEQWRDGMQGEARVDCGHQRLAWIWTHRFVDWVRIKLWV